MSKSSTEIRSDQLAPHSIEAERAVLGSILLNPDVWLEVGDGLTAEDFFLVRHGFIWDALTRLFNRRDPVDELTLTQELEAAGQLSEIGGASYVVGLVNETPSAVNAEGYAAIVRRMAIRRRLIEAAGGVARLAHSDETDIEEVADGALRLIDDAVRDAGEADVSSARDRASAHYDRLVMLMTARAEGREPDGAVLCGLKDLDTLLGQFKPDDLYYIAARPGMGKSSLLDQIVLRNAQAGVPCLFLSYEMSKEQIDTRILSILANVSYDALEAGRLTQEQVQAYVKAVETYAALPLYILDDVTRNSPATARMVLRKAIRKFGIKALVVDYVQLMAGQGENRNAELTEVSRWLKLVAREFHIPVIAAAQLSRAVEQRADKRPLLSDLRDSGSLEQDADAVVFIYRDSYYNEDSPDGNKTELHVAKHRNGPTGTVDVIWFPERMKFVDARKISVNTETWVDPLTEAKSNPPALAAKDYQAAAGGDRDE